MTMRRVRLTGRSIATSRSAAIGGTRAALRAGTMADSNVTTVPTTRPHTTAVTGTTVPVPGRSIPMAVITAILIGGGLLGAFGIVIAIPLAASVKIVWEEFVLPVIRANAAQPPRPPDAGTAA